MMILHVTDSGAAVPGGRETHINSFSILSGSIGHGNTIVTPRQVASIPAPPDVILLHSRDAWAAAPAIRKAFPASRIIAWVHDQSFVCAASISWFRKTKQECCLPLGGYCFTNAYTLHCNARRPDRNLANCLSVKRSLEGIPALDGIIVASEYMKSRLVSGRVPESVIYVLPYFVVEHTTQSLRPSSNDARRILYVGRLNETKGVDVLIRAMAHLPSDALLTIAGDGYVIEDLKGLASQYDSPAGRITFIGHLSDPEAVERVYRSADVLAIPSLWPEPFGIVGLEAMINGIPVVASRVGGIPEWLVHGETGYLTVPGDPVDLAKKLVTLLEDRQLREAFGERAREHVLRSYSWHDHWNGFVAILSALRRR